MSEERPKPKARKKPPPPRRYPPVPAKRQVKQPKKKTRTRAHLGRKHMGKYSIGFGTFPKKPRRGFGEGNRIGET